MQDLSITRQEIDKIDKDLLKLYLKRLALADEVAEYKIANNKPVLDPKREEEKLAVLSAEATDDFEKEGIREFFEQIMSNNRKRQYRLLREKGQTVDSGFIRLDSFDFSDITVVYQGVEGAYSQMACNQFFGENINSFHVTTWREAMEDIKKGKADYAVLPIENSTAGAVSENYDLLSEYDAAIIGEKIIKIDHALLALPDAELSDIKTVYSHPQALMQCDRFLHEKHPEFEAKSMLNTAVSAQKVKNDNDKSQAAIAGEINAQIYGLKILERSIQNDASNETRFIIISGQKKYLKDASHISICFELPNEEGSLYRVLSNIAFNGLNMSRIASRPIEGRPWEYRFFIDFDGNLDDDAVVNALLGLLQETSRLKILGNY